jgi:hypothetical protein
MGRFQITIRQIIATVTFGHFLCNSPMKKAQPSAVGGNMSNVLR